MTFVLTIIAVICMVLGPIFLLVAYITFKDLNKKTHERTYAPLKKCLSGDLHGNPHEATNQGFAEGMVIRKRKGIKYINFQSRPTQETIFKAFSKY